MKTKWRYGIIAGIFLAIFSLYPQMKMVYLRGSEWNGHYAYNDIDEVAYASYLKALIDGRPRKNDPYTGRDDSTESPQPESLFSIQFAGPYTIAMSSRLLGVPATWAMTLGGAVAAFLAALAIFWLINSITRDPLYAMADAIIVLAGGALFAGEGAISEILAPVGEGFAYPYFPGFRRYIPAMAMPAFFALVALVWKLVSGPTAVTAGSNTDRDERNADLSANDANPPVATGGSDTGARLVFVLLAIAAFAYTVFSYFYVWTTAAAWLGCLGLLWMAVRPDGVWRDVKTLAILGAGCLAALIPYFYLLSKRSHTMDDVQMLVLTHAPDLTRAPEIIGFTVVGMIVVGAIMRMWSLRDKPALFVLSIALTPAIVFNQQVITGQSLQPIHYQVFIGNYVAGLALVGVFALIWRGIEWRSELPARLMIAAIAAVAVAWGFVECHYTVRVLDDVNVIRDEHLPVGRRLTELGLGDAKVHERVVLDLGIAEADDLPTVAPQSVLWARHQHVFAGVTQDENKERYYQLLFYQGVPARNLAEGMKRGGDFVSMIALFGWGRHTDRLNSNFKPLTFGEIDREAARYDEYARSLTRSTPGFVELDYLVAPAEGDVFYDNIDRLFVRDSGEVIGKYVLYRLTAR